MANKLTLDEALADLYEHTGDKDLDPEWVDVVRQNNKQAILQWVADTYEMSIDEVTRKASNG